MDIPKHIEGHPFGFASRIIFNNFIKNHQSTLWCFTNLHVILKLQRIWKQGKILWLDIFKGFPNQLDSPHLELYF